MGKLKSSCFLSPVLIFSGIGIGLASHAGEIPNSSSCRAQNAVRAETLVAQNDHMRYELQCSSGQAQLRRAYFLSNGNLALSLQYQQGLPVELKSYNIDGALTGLTRFEHPSQGHVIRTKISLEAPREGWIDAKEELIGFDAESTSIQTGAIAVKVWSFDRDKRDHVDFIALHSPENPDRITAKEYPSSNGKPQSVITFHYRDQEPKPYRFTERDSSGRILTAYSLYEKFDPARSLQKAGLPRTEIERRLRHQQSSDRFLMAIIDSGFDYNHPELAWKWWNNPSDPVNGIDDDGNGWIDDNFGWEREKNIGLPTESSTDLASDIRPDSHGTHVAHIATRDLEGVGLIGFAGDYTRAAYIDQISKFLKIHQVKVVNISIGLPKDNKDELGLRDGIKAYQRMMADNPDTLFVVAAGNEEMDIDIHRNRQYPASINLPNVLKVGALNTSKIDRTRFDSYEMSFWSNIGETSVDLLAPGEDISAARLGGGLVVHSGTSMASPYMAHEAARLWMKFPKMKAAEVRDAFIRSAYQMKIRPAIVSGGFVDFEAAEKLAKELTKDRNR